MKKLICDSSSLISLSETCLLWALRDMKNMKFVLPPAVKGEIVDYPLHVKRFELKAIYMEDFLHSKQVELFTHPRLEQESRFITDLANSLFTFRNKHIKIIQAGEAGSMAAMKLMHERNLLVDERTTRLLIEDIDILKKYIESRTGLKLEINSKEREALEEELSKFRVIRSVEVFAYLYDKGEFSDLDPKILEAGLWALKFAGCSVTQEEITDYLRMLK